MIRSLFISRSPSDAGNFRDRVLKIAKASFPGVPFEPAPENLDKINSGKTQIGLGWLEAAPLGRYVGARRAAV
jgi:hypothetical protein